MTLRLLSLSLSLQLVVAEISVHSFEEYVSDAERNQIYTRNGNDQLRVAVASAEKTHKDKVVLYHVMPIYGYLRAWLMHGLLAKEALQWKRLGEEPGVATQLPLQLRLFDPGLELPSFALHDASVCVAKGKRKVREADPVKAQALGDGDWTNYWLNKEKFYNISYSKTWKVYNDCRDLVYSDLVEANLKVGPLLEEKQLKAAGVTTGKQFAQYLDKQVGSSWQDAPFPEGYSGLPTVGVQDRLLKTHTNLLGTATSNQWQSENDEMSVWAQFTNYVDVYGDLNADQFSGGSRPYFGDRISAFDQLLSALSPGQAVIQKVDNLLSLLKCAAQMRFPIYQQNFWRRQKIMERCWSGSAEPFPPDSPKMDLDTVASTRTKELTKALHSGGLPTEALTRGYSRVLLQVVLPADIANDLAYISTDWQNKSGLPPGHEHEEWAGVSFLEAYSKLKNTGEGDGFTARVLLRRAPFYTWDTVELTAYSQVFLDEDFMEFAESILNDIRGYVLGTPQATHSHWHFLEILGVVVLFLAGLVVLSIFLRYRQPRPSSTEAPARDVELQPAGSL